MEDNNLKVKKNLKNIIEIINNHKTKNIEKLLVDPSHFSAQKSLSQFIDSVALVLLETNNIIEESIIKEEFNISPEVMSYYNYVINKIKIFKDSMNEIINSEKMLGLTTKPSDMQFFNLSPLLEKGIKDIELSDKAKVSFKNLCENIDLSLKNNKEDSKKNLKDALRSTWVVLGINETDIKEHIKNMRENPEKNKD